MQREGLSVFAPVSLVWVGMVMDESGLIVVLSLAHVQIRFLDFMRTCLSVMLNFFSGLLV